MPLRYRVELTGIGVEGSGVNTTYWRQLSPSPTQAELDGISQSLEDFWGDLCTNTIGSFCAGSLTASFNGEVEDVDVETGQIVEVYSANTWSVDGSGEDIAAKATQAVAQLRTGHFVNGRELRGRIYVPSLNQDVLSNNGSLDSSAAGDLGDACEKLVLEDDGEDYWMVIYSRTHGTEAPVSSARASSTLAVLRSRRD